MNKEKEQLWCYDCHEEILDNEPYVIFQGKIYHENPCWTGIKNTQIIDEEL